MLLGSQKDITSLNKPSLTNTRRPTDLGWINNVIKIYFAQAVNVKPHSYRCAIFVVNLHWYAYFLSWNYKSFTGCGCVERWCTKAAGTWVSVQYGRPRQRQFVTEKLCTHDARWLVVQRNCLSVLWCEPERLRLRYCKTQFHRRHTVVSVEQKRPRVKIRRDENQAIYLNSAVKRAKCTALTS